MTDIQQIQLLSADAEGKSLSMLSCTVSFKGRCQISTLFLCCTLKTEPELWTGFTRTQPVMVHPKFNLNLNFQLRAWPEPEIFRNVRLWTWRIWKFRVQVRCRSKPKLIIPVQVKVRLSPRLKIQVRFKLHHFRLTGGSGQTQNWWLMFGSKTCSGQNPN